MSTLTHREHQGPFVDILDWFDAPWGVFRPVRDNPMRVEDFIKDGHYVLRAELPGIDPDKDLELTVSSSVLTIRAHRQEETETKYRAEFRYGVFTRSVKLPAGADEDHIQASYDAGVLEVTVSLHDQVAGTKQQRIPVRTRQHIKPT
jgi:HSP20 family molecular chaperone IbpA